MKTIVIAAVSAFALAACATATPYQPAGVPGAPGGSARGYAEQRIEANRWRVSFSGNSMTSRDTVEMYLLHRAAELTVESGHDWFSTQDRSTDRETRYVGSPDPWYGSYYGRSWGPRWRFYRRGLWSPWNPFWGRDFDVHEVIRYEANAEIVMGRGPKPVGDSTALDAREVLSNLGPRILRPAPR